MTARSYDYNGVSLVEFCTEHITQEYLDSLNDKWHVRFSQQRFKKHTRDSCVEYIRNQSEIGAPFLACFIDEVHVGNVGISLDQRNKIGNISIFIFKNYAGSGLGKKIFIAAIQVAQCELDCTKVEAGTMATNKPMLALMKSAGMLPDGVRVGHFITSDGPVDCIYYAASAKSRLPLSRL